MSEQSYLKLPVETFMELLRLCPRAPIDNRDCTIYITAVLECCIERIVRLAGKTCSVNGNPMITSESVTSVIKSHGLDNFRSTNYDIDL